MKSTTLSAALAFAALTLTAGSCADEAANAASTDIITSLTKDGARLNCVTHDHKARLSFNRTGDGQIFLERYDPNSPQDVSEEMLVRVMPSQETAPASPNPASTHFMLSKGIEGDIAVLGSGVCTDAQSGERSNLSFKISDWGEYADQGYENAGCCRVLAE